MRALAFSVHILTACGAALALLALLAATRGDWPLMFFWLGVALVVDAVDGPLARALNVQSVLPRWSGETLDLVVDYTTYVFVPAYAVAVGGLMPEGWAIAAAATIAITGTLYFADREMKTEDNFFRGFPAVWNLVVFYLLLCGRRRRSARRNGGAVRGADICAVPVRASVPGAALARRDGRAVDTLGGASRRRGRQELAPDPWITVGTVRTCSILRGCRAGSDPEAERLMASKNVLLITGAGRGIGAATARLAAARGYDVGVNYKTDAKSAADVVAAVKAQGRKAVAIQADMGREADVERMFKEADALGRLTHFVYNAGIPGRAGRLESADSAMMREVIEVNVLGALWSMQHAIRRMSKKHGGAGRLDRAAVVGRSRHRRAQRIRLVRRLQGRGRSRSPMA